MVSPLESPSSTAINAIKKIAPFKASERLKSLSETPIWVKALIYGDSGVGKTWIAATAPNPLLVLSEWAVSRLTLERLRQDLGIDPDVIYIESEEQCLEAYAYARAHAHKYDTLVLDSITDINDRIMREVLNEARAVPRKDGRPPHDEDILEQGDWNKVLRRTSYILQLYRDFPGHTVVTAVATIEDMRIVPMIYPKSLRKMIISQFNLAGYLSAEAKQNKPSTRMLQTDMVVSCVAKSPGGFIPAVVESPDMGKIIQQITAGAQTVPNTKNTEEETTNA
ncbi:MAG: hypothetical protein DDT33_01205 [Firmicutes bacterium]|nr:hypothetical protein [Bacillota bacterium]